MIIKSILRAVAFSRIFFTCGNEKKFVDYKLHETSGPKTKKNANYF